MGSGKSSAALKGIDVGSLGDEPANRVEFDITEKHKGVEPNSISIAIEASSGDCVHHILQAVLSGKVT